MEIGLFLRCEISGQLQLDVTDATWSEMVVQLNRALSEECNALHGEEIVQESPLVVGIGVQVVCNELKYHNLLCIRLRLHWKRW